MLASSSSNPFENPNPNPATTTTIPTHLQQRQYCARMFCFDQPEASLNDYKFSSTVLQNKYKNHLHNLTSKDKMENVEKKRGKLYFTPMWFEPCVVYPLTFGNDHITPLWFVN